MQSVKTGCIKAKNVLSKKSPMYTTLNYGVKLRTGTASNPPSSKTTGQVEGRVHKQNQNPVIVVYRRPLPLVITDRVLQLFGAGEFTHCEMYLPKDMATFAIFAGGQMQCSAVLSHLYVKRPDLFAWHMFVLNNVEYERLRVWNIEQVYKHCKYNLKDLMFQILPTTIQKSYVKDLSKERAHAPKTMFCSQAVVLALREACSGQGGSPHIEAFATSMNSRITTPSDIANKVVKDLGMELRYEPVPLTYNDAQVCMQQNMLLGDGLV